MRNQFINAFKVSFLAIVLSFGLSYALAWTAPSATPPSGNVSAPLNTSSTAQVKTGALTVGGFVNSGVATTTKLSVTDTISSITTGLNVTPLYVPASTYTYCSSGSPRDLSCPPGQKKFTGTNPAYGGATLNVESSNLAMRNVMLQTGTGNVAIGDTGALAPSQKLTVVGAIGATGDICTSTGGISKCLSNLAPHGSVKFASGSTWKAPTGVSAVYVTATGGGGGGGGNTTWNGACADSGGGGGGAGAFAFKNLVGVTPGTTYTIAVGTAGGGGPVSGTSYSGTAGAGGNGGDSGIVGVITVLGGKGGQGVNGSCNAAGGLGGSGTGSGANIYFGEIVAGTNGSRATGTTGGGGAGISTYGSPSYGSGGKGAAAGSGGNVKGSAGQPGFVLIEW